MILTDGEKEITKKMRTINNDKGSFATKGNTNGTYDYMQRNVSDVSKARFSQKPYYMTAGNQVKNRRNKVC